MSKALKDKWRKEQEARLRMRRQGAGFDENVGMDVRSREGRNARRRISREKEAIRERKGHLRGSYLYEQKRKNPDYDFHDEHMKIQKIIDEFSGQNEDGNLRKLKDGEKPHDKHMKRNKKKFFKDYLRQKEEKKNFKRKEEQYDEHRKKRRFRKPPSRPQWV